MSTGLLGFQSIEDRQGSAFSYVSPSRLALWCKCPLAWRLRYLDGLKTPTTPSLFLGKSCHKLLEAHYRHRQMGVTLAIADLGPRLVESWAELIDGEGMKFSSVADEQALQRQAVDLVAAYLKAVPADEPRPLAVEVALESSLVDPASGEDLGIPLVGVMDLVLDNPEGPSIIDFKTSARSDEPLEITHELQLSSYAWLFRQNQGRSEAALEIRSLIKTKVAKVEFHAYPARTEVHFRRLFSLVREYLDALDAGLFTYRPGFGCGMCDFRDGPCRAWQG